MVQKIAIKDIVIGQRHRHELGDLKPLADSIQSLGMLQPIGVSSALQLIWGERRLRACQELGWTEVDAVVDPSMDDTLRAMKAEADENLCRKEFTAVEAVAISEHIEAFEREAAQDRQQASRAKPGQQVGEIGSAQFAGPKEPPKSGQVFQDSSVNRISENESPSPVLTRGETRELVAAAVGMSHTTLTKAKKVVAKGTPELIEAMDNRAVSIDAAARLVDLPPEKQRKVVAGGKKAVRRALATARQPRRPNLCRVVEQLESFTKLRPSELHMGALAEAIRQLREELGPLLR